MAFRRSVSARAKLFYQQQPQRAALPFSRIDRDDNDRTRCPQGFPTYDLRRGGNVASFSFSGARNVFGDPRFAVPTAYAPVFARNMSTERQGAEIMNEGAEKVIEAVAPVANETTEAAMNTSHVDPLHLQYLTDHLNALNSVDWFVSMAFATIFIRTLMLPSTIRPMKKDLIKSEMAEIEKEMKRSDMSPEAVAASVARMTELSKASGVNGYTNTAVFVYTASVVTLSSSLIMLDMTPKVLAIIHGVTFWFTHYWTTSDASFVWPLLGAMEAALGYWLASSVFEVAVTMAMISPGGMKMLGIANGDETRAHFVKRLRRVICRIAL